MTRLAQALPSRAGGYWGVEAEGSDIDARAIRNGDVGTSGELRWDALPLRGFTEREFGKARVHAGDIVLTTSGNCGNVAYIGAEPEEPTVATNFVRVLRVDPLKVDSRYAFHYLRSGWFTAGIAPFVRGATIKNLSVESAFAAIEIPLPSLPEQRRIAAILDHAESLFEKRRHRRTLLLVLAQSLHEQHTSAASELSVAELLVDGVLQVHKDGNHGSLYPRADEFAPDGVPFLTAKAIGDDGVIFPESVDHLREEKANQLRIGWITQGDVLLSHNASVGKVAVYDGQFGDALIGTSLTCFRADPSQLDPRFLAASLRAQSFQRQLKHNMAQTTRNQVPITAQRLLKLKWLALGKQQAFVAMAERVDAQLQDTQRSVSAHNDLFCSLQSRAFRGEL